MARDRRVYGCVAGVAALAQAGVWTVSVMRGDAVAHVVAAVVQVVAVMPLVWLVPRRRVLAAALGLAVPIIGPIAATLAATVHGHGGRELLRELHADTRQVDGQQIAHALVGALPACEAIVSADGEVRRACLARLARRASASDVAVLRWARTHSSGEIAVEIALAIEDAVERFEARAAAARAAVARSPGYTTSAQAFRVLAAGVCSGIFDEPALSQLASEARQHHDAAVSADPERARELLVERARLELAVDRPEAVLELLAPRPVGNRELIRIYKQAAYAARRFELTTALSFRRSRAHARV